MPKAIINYQSLRKKYYTLQWAESFKKSYLLRTAIIVCLSVFMLWIRVYTRNKSKSNTRDVPAVLSPTATDCKVQWERAVSLLIRELSFLTPALAARPGWWEATLTGCLTNSGQIWWLQLTPTLFVVVYNPLSSARTEQHHLSCPQEGENWPCLSNNFELNNTLIRRSAGVPRSACLVLLHCTSLAVVNAVRLQEHYTHSWSLLHTASTSLMTSAPPQMPLPWWLSSS